MLLRLSAGHGLTGRPASGGPIQHKEEADDDPTIILPTRAWLVFGRT
jgi:hypothetical protein